MLISIHSEDKFMKLIERKEYMAFLKITTQSICLRLMKSDLPLTMMAYANKTSCNG